MSQRDEKKEVVAIIPARGGSKGIPRKNIIDLCGKPLIAYTIEAALKTKLISRVVVSTDDEEIAEISEKYGAEVPFLRPQNLAGDRADVGDAIDYTVAKLGESGYEADALVQLYPTHPFRTPRLLNSLTSLLLSEYGQILTVKPLFFNDTIFLYHDKAGNTLRLTPTKTSGVSGSMVRHYGLYYGVRLKGPRPLNQYLYSMTDPISLIDIDYLEDLFFAREIILNNLFPFDLV